MEPRLQILQLKTSNTCQAQSQLNINSSSDSTQSQLNSTFTQTTELGTTQLKLVSLMAFPTTFVVLVVTTNVVGTTILINSLNIGQFNFEVFMGGNEPKILSGEIWPPSQKEPSI